MCDVRLKCTCKEHEEGGVFVRQQTRFTDVVETAEVAKQDLKTRL